ncbi:MAG: IclR family transcriptional regulator C-terminal domain-containing protein [Burkholderiales bacterium]
MSTKAPREPETVASLARGLAVIECFGDGSNALTLSEVARRARISRAAARRLLHTLVALGYAGFDGKAFSLRPRVLRLGFAYLSSTSVWDVAREWMDELVRETGESCSAAVLDGTDIVHIIRKPSARRLMSIAVRVGDRLPAHASAMGRVMLAALPSAELERYFDVVQLRALTPRTITDPRKLRAELDRVRLQGYSEVNGELDLALKAIAVPVIDAQGTTVGAIALSSLADGTADNALLAPLQRCAAGIRKALAGLPSLPDR